MQHRTFQKFYSYFIFILFIPGIGNSQIERVSLELQFNDSTTLHDCYLVIDKGTTTNHRDRIQFNAQISFTMRTGTKVSVAKRFFPLTDNRNYDGKDPMMWYIADKIISPPAMPGYDIFNVLPMLSPTSRYNELREGDKILLFSLSVDHQEASELSLFKNETVTSGNISAFNGGDFRIGFTIGDIKQKYFP